MPRNSPNPNRLIMDIISKKMTSYAATQWLKSPNEKLGNNIPSEMMQAGNSDAVYKQLKQEINKKRNG